MSTETKAIIKVGISDAKVARAPYILKTTGLGSCVGIVIYNPFSNVAGMAHIMLSESKMAKKNDFNPMKYADTAIDYLFRTLVEEGMNKHGMKAIIVGGAQMFRFKTSSDLMRIGPRNTEAVKLEMKKRGVPVIAEETGGSNGRTIEFNIESYELTVKTVNAGEKVLK
ncbi:chemotaxis protein CheD [Salimicrobium flavidum]|uniref:Probable chemoreceptor glutamine deamidase CheD n=1 Tax=Salimicrobium flavidum TaxID=570947 RepID=A0A1N7IKR7_9BACI|nr:chemotaxis protein CheD [Salimicrobium flavidum]SIS37571.1 chemotaxis protein CheD [Salimicrobium flavidum]